MALRVTQAVNPLVCSIVMTWLQAKEWRLGSGVPGVAEAVEKL